MNLKEPEYANRGLTLIRVPEEFEGEFAIPEGVMEVGDDAFFGCANLTAVKFPTTLKRIGECAFKFCQNLESVDIPDSVIEIGQQAFYDCKLLTNVKLPANLSEIRSKTFSQTAIRELEIPNSVKLIEDEAFYGCYYLQDIQLPKDIEIADSAFKDCNSLFSTDALYLDLYGNPHYKLVKVFPHAFHYSIPDDVVEIGSNVIESCDNIDSIVIPDSVKKIHDGAFSGSKIKTLKIGNGVTGLPDFCFSDCESLEKVDIPDHISGIGQCCFSNCISIRSIKIPDSVSSLEPRCFKGCRNLQSINLGNSIEAIYEESFSGCSMLTEISIPQSVKTIGERAFYGCKNLQNIKLGNFIEAICEEAFYGCSKLIEISLPKSLITIGKMAFFGCSLLEKVDYSNNVSVGIDSFHRTLVKDSYLLPEFKYYGKILPSQWESDTPPGNTMLRVYRGINVKNVEIAEQLIKDIKENGLYLEQFEKFKVDKYNYKDPRGHNKLTKEELDSLYSNKLLLETASVGFGKDQVYFGDYVCAMNYATPFCSSDSIPIIIEAEIPLDELNVDGVDSLAHIFNPYSDNGLVREVFGKKIDMYYEKYRAEAKSFDGMVDRKLLEAMTNMAESDNDIVYAFYKNNRVIHGKFGNIFKYAFQAKLPIRPERILSVKVVSKEPRPEADLFLGDFR